MTDEQRYARGEPMPPDGDRPLLRTGTEEPIGPEELAMAAGLDPTPENIEWAQRKLAEEGMAAAEKLVE